MKSLRRICLSAVLTAGFIILSPVALSQSQGYGPPTLDQAPPFPIPKAGYAVEGRPGPPGSGFVLHYELASVPWEPFEGSGIPAGLQRRLESQSPSMGAVAQITYVPAGWSHPAGYHDVDHEIFVLEGDLTISGGAGEEKLTRYSYSYMPAGEMHGLKSRQGAVLLEWWKGKPDFVASNRDKKGARDYARVRDWNRYKKAWYMGKPFPDYRTGGNFPDAIHALMRKDPDTGEMTWMSFAANIPAPPSGKAGATMGGNYEIHPSFEEYFWLEMSQPGAINECLEQGEITARFGNRTYWWRPAGIGHGGRPPMSPGPGKPGYSISIVRTGTTLWADYVTDCSYKTGNQYMGLGKGWRKYDYNVPRYKVDLHE